MPGHGYQGPRERYGEHRIPGTTSDCGILGREGREKELRARPWPEGVHFEDAAEVEKPLVSRFDHETSRSFCGNSTEMAFHSRFAE